MIRRIPASFFICCIAAFVFAGCGGSKPAPLKVEEIPAAFQKAFQSGPDGAKMIISGVIKQVERQQFAPASFQLQNMLSDRSLSKDQRSLVARALITINGLMQQQIDTQEAAIAPLPANSAPKARPNENPPPSVTPEAAAESKAVMEIYRRTK